MTNQLSIDCPIEATPSNNYTAALAEYQKDIKAGHKPILYYCSTSKKYSSTKFSSVSGLQSFGLKIIKN